MMTNLSKIIFATIAIALLASSTLYSSSPDRPTREEITINQDRQPIEPERYSLCLWRLFMTDLFN